MSDASTVEGVEVDTRHWIGGERVASATTFTDVSPIDETAARRDRRRRRATRSTAPSPPPAPPSRPGRRSRSPSAPAILRRRRRRDRARAEDLASVETRDNGSLLRSHRRGVMPRVAQNFRFFADWRRAARTTTDFEIRGHRERISCDPAGVVAIITPWNAPLMLATWRIGPALAAGNTVVLKPPEWAPLTASLLADIAAEAGLPAGVFNVVQGNGAEAGAPLTAHPGIRRLSLHRLGADRRGDRRGRGANIVPLSLRARRQVAAGGLRRRRPRPRRRPGGRAVRQRRPGLPRRVPDPGRRRRIADEFTRRVVERARRSCRATRATRRTDVGAAGQPRQHFERVDGFVERAIADGAKPVLGGGPNDELGGLYYRADDPAPTPSQDSEIVTEEVFGPVLTMQTFATEDEARRDWPTTPASAWPPPWSPATTSAPSGSARGSTPARSGSTASSSATSAPRSAATASRASAARAAPGRFDFYCDIKNTVFSPTAGPTRHGREDGH